MAIIKRKDIYEGGKAFSELKREIDELIVSVKSLQKETREVNKSGSGSDAKERLNLAKQLTTQTGKLTVAQQNLDKEIIAQRIETQRLNKINKESAELANKNTGAYRKQSIELNKLVRKYQDMAVSEGTASKEAKNLLTQITKLDTKLKQVDNSVGRNQRSVGKYSNALKGLGRQLLGAAGITAGFTALFRVVGNSVKIFKDFDKSASRLGSILGKTKDEITALTEQAKELGSTTAFTASEVISLQTELAKLGFTTEQIEKSTRGILDLAAATGSDLASAAELAGSTLRIFNLDASEMGRVTDVLAKSTTISSLSMEKLATILPTLGKTAQIAGVSLERTAALAGTLTDRGLEASTAGTSLRNIFLKLAKDGITWDDAMKKVNGSTDKLKTAVEVFGVKASTAGIIISETADSTDQLTTSLENAEGAANSMAEAMLDNLAGDITKANSAWEGFILSVEDGNGVISRVMRNATQWFAGLFEGLKKINEGESLFLQKLKKDSDIVGQVAKRWEEYVRQIKMANTAEEEANIIGEKKAKLQQKLRGLQFSLNKLKEEEKDISIMQRASTMKPQILRAQMTDLKFQISFYEELKTKLTDYNKQLDENTTEVVDLEKANQRLIASNGDLVDGNGKVIKTASQLTKEYKAQKEAAAALAKEEERRAEIAAENAKIKELGVAESVKDVQVSEEAGVDPLTAELAEIDRANAIKLAKEAAFRDKIKDLRLEKLTEMMAELYEKESLTKDEQEELDKLRERSWQEVKKGIKEAAIDSFGQYVSNANAAAANDKIEQSKRENETTQNLLKDKLQKGEITEAQFKRQSAAANKKARQEEAKASRNAALFDIAIGTAVGIIKAISNTGLPAAIPLIAATIVLGALSAALVLSQPTPKFAKGEVGIKGKSHAQGGKNVNIEGGESIITREGTSKAPELLEAINKGMLSDSDLPSLVSKGLAFDKTINVNNNQRDGSIASLLMQGNKKADKIAMALLNGVSQYTINGITHTIFADGSQRYQEING